MLRAIQPDEIKDIIEISYYDSVKASTIQEASDMQSKIILDYQKGHSIHWGIINNDNNQIIGTCGYYRGFEQETGELGCVLLPQFRRRGLMKEALTLAIEFGIHTIQLHRIRAVTNSLNHPAIKLLESLNFVKVKNLPFDDIEFVYTS